MFFHFHARDHFVISLVVDGNADVVWRVVVVTAVVVVVISFGS